MQTLAAYVIFLLVVVAVGLAVILSTIVFLAAYEGITWMKDYPGFRRWKTMIIEALVAVRARLKQEFHNLNRAIPVQLLHPSRWRVQ